MRRGTTPTVRLSVDYDLTGWDVYVTFEQRSGYSRRHELTKKPDSITATETGCDVEVTLTQCETLALSPIKTSVQIRAELGGDTVCSTVWTFQVSDILLEGKIPREVE